jgi:hypothetical protein
LYLDVTPWIMGTIIIMTVEIREMCFGR